MLLKLINQQNQFITRVRLSIVVIIIGLIILLVSDVYIAGVSRTEVGIIISIIGLLWLNSWLSEDTVQVVNGIVLWGSATLVFYMSWVNDGIFDAALYAYPCIIMVAFISGSRILSVPLILAITVQLMLITYAHQRQLLMPVKVYEYTYLVRLIDLLVIFAFSGLISFVYINGFKISLTQMKIDNRKYQRQLKRSDKLLKVDHLTKLPNERIFQKEVTQFLTELTAQDAKLSLMILDISNIRQIVNSLGYEIGEQLLLAIAQRLNSILSPQEYLYRMHGYEFALVKIAERSEEIDVFKERILQAMNSEFVINEHQVSTFCHIGIAVAPFDGKSIASLLKSAHLALQHGKKQHANNACYFEMQMKEKQESRYFYLVALKNSIINNELALYYQPKIDLQSREIVGVEALLRWIHPEKGFLPPNDFIPIAEESGFITEISKWVISQACIDCKRWKAAGFANIGVAVNLSAIDFRRGNLPKIVNKALTISQLPPHALELEITESTIFDDVNQIQNQIQQLQSKGVSFAIDDFGTGYSNLGYLSQFNVSTLKIDQSFVRNIIRNNHDQHIVKAIIDMSKSLGIRNVAEGIEDEDIANWLKQQGCQVGQGYYWSKPCPYDELIAFFKQYRG